MNKTHLGDGVYAQFNEAGQLALTTHDSKTTTNTIHLEQKVLEALFRYLTDREAGAHGYVARWRPAA